MLATEIYFSANDTSLHNQKHIQNVGKSRWVKQKKKYKKNNFKTLLFFATFCPGTVTLHVVFTVLIQYRLQAFHGMFEKYIFLETLKCNQSEKTMFTFA